jgi:hypothetical protein
MRFTDLTTGVSALAAAMLIQQGQAGCSPAIVACYSAAGLTFGTVAAAAAPAVALKCSAALSLTPSL